MLSNTMQSSDPNNGQVQYSNGGYFCLLNGLLTKWYLKSKTRLSDSCTLNYGEHTVTRSSNVNTSLWLPLCCICSFRQTHQLTILLKHARGLAHLICPFLRILCVLFFGRPSSITGLKKVGYFNFGL